MTADIIGLIDAVCRCHGRMTDSQLRYGIPSGFLRRIAEICLRINPRGIADDVGHLFGPPHGAVVADTVEYALISL